MYIMWVYAKYVHRAYIDGGARVQYVSIQNWIPPETKAER